MTYHEWTDEEAAGHSPRKRETNMSLEFALEASEIDVATAYADGYELSVNATENERYEDVYVYTIERGGTIVYRREYKSLRALIAAEDVQSYHGIALTWQPESK